MGFNVFRAYTNDDSFENLEEDFPKGCVNQFQVILAYARDYNGINSTYGNFTPYWDTAKVTPEKIAKFKDGRHKTTHKVLLSIGNKGEQFPFNCGSDTRTWISNATTSLKLIIKDYNLDGIDVHYDKIESGKDDFIECISSLIQNLKLDKVITVASIAPNYATSAEFYHPIYLKYNSLINIVDYQCFNGFTPGPNNPVKALEKNVQDTAQEYKTVENFLVGYSSKVNDWATVSPPLFFVAFFQLLTDQKVSGSSLNIVTDSTSVSSFPPKWILELLSLAYN